MEALIPGGFTIFVGAVVIFAIVIIRAGVKQDLDFSAKEISKAKRTKETFVVELNEPLQVEITYDTLVVEAGTLHIYPDVYSHKKNTTENLRKELEANGIDASDVPDATLGKMLSRARAKRQYAITLAQIRAGNYLDGKVIPVLEKKIKTKKRRIRRRRK